PPGGEGGDQQENRRQKVEPRIRADFEFADGRRWDSARSERTARKPGPGIEYQVRKLTNSQRADGEVISAQAEQREAEEIADRSGDQDRNQERQPIIFFEA